MRDGLAPFLGQRQRFAATIDRIGVKDGWRSAITVLLKDVELADTGDVVADHLWLRYGPWADELASGLQVGARITFDAGGNPLREGVHGRQPGETSRPAQETGLRAGEDSNPSVAVATVGLGELPGLRSVLAMRWGYCYAKKATEHRFDAGPIWSRQHSRLKQRVKSTVRPIRGSRGLNSLRNVYLCEPRGGPDSG